MSEKQIYFCTIPGDEKSPGPHSQPMDMKKILFLAWALLAMVEAGAANRQLSEKSTTMSKLANDTRVFAIDPAIDVQGVRFKNRFGIELAGHLYLPKNFDSSKKYAAIAVSGPFGAVKEQASGLYAQEMAYSRYISEANGDNRLAYRRAWVRIAKDLKGIYLSSSRK